MLCQRGEDIAAIQILGTGDGVARPRAVGGADVVHLHQQLLRWHDGEVARCIGDGVVACGETAGVEHAGVGACGHICTAAGHRQRAGKPRCGRCFAVHEAGVVDAVVVARISQRDKLGVIVGAHGQRGLVNGAAAVAPGQGVVASIGACQRDRALLHRAAARIGAVKHGSTRHADRVAALESCQTAVAHVGRRHAGGAIVCFGDAIESGQRQARGRDVGRGVAAGGEQDVVGAIGAGEGHAGQVHGLGYRHIFVAEQRVVGGDDVEHIAADAVIGGGHGGGRGRVVHLVHAGVAHAQGFGRDDAVGARQAGAAERVVGGINARQGETTDRVTGGDTGVLAGVSPAAAHRQIIAADLAWQAKREVGHAGAAVIHLGDVGSACRDRLLCHGQVAHHRQRVAEVGAGLGDVGGANLVAAHFQVAGRAVLCAQGTQRKGGGTACTIGQGDVVAPR